ncbi:hypothetical protein TNCV_3616941 [Trichonephila clavipes]|nr:hypothetical protein TNCV_3616941 [Trichonephila clavipes]
MNLICPLPCPTPSQDISSTREPNPVEARDVGSCLNIQSHAITVLVKVVTQKCLGGPPVYRNRLNVYA